VIVEGPKRILICSTIISEGSKQILYKKMSKAISAAESAVIKLRMGVDNSRSNTNNYEEWLEYIQKHVLPKYGKEFYDLVFTHIAIPILPPVEADYLPQILGPDPANPGGLVILPHGLTAAMVNELRMDSLKTWNKRRKVVRDQEGPKFFTEIRSLLSDNSLAIIETHANYQLALTTSDFTGLWMIIRTTHFTHYRGGNPQAVIRERNALLTVYRTTKQRPDESVDAYYKNFKRTRDKLTVLGDALPNEADEVQHFLSNLDQTRYRPLLTDYENRVNSGQANVYPATIVSACEQVLRWKPLLDFTAPTTDNSSIIFHTYY